MCAMAALTGTRCGWQSGHQAINVWPLSRPPVLLHLSLPPAGTGLGGAQVRAVRLRAGTAQKKCKEEAQRRKGIPNPAHELPIDLLRRANDNMVGPAARIRLRRLVNNLKRGAVKRECVFMEKFPRRLKAIRIENGKKQHEIYKTAHEIAEQIGFDVFDAFERSFHTYMYRTADLPKAYHHLGLALPGGTAGLDQLSF